MFCFQIFYKPTCWGKSVKVQLLYNYFLITLWILLSKGSGMSTAKRKSILVSFYKSVVGTLFPVQEPNTSEQGKVWVDVDKKVFYYFSLCWYKVSTCRYKLHNPW